MTLLILYLLSVTDGAFCGYRGAAGRSALIDKRAYYRRALLRGAALVQAAALLAGVALLLLFVFARDRDGLTADLLAAGRRMLLVYLPYSAVVLLTFLVRLLPSVDLRSASSVFVFGLLTAVRPLVAIVGVAYGIFGARRIETRVLAVAVLIMMFAVQALLDRVAARQAAAYLDSGSRPAASSVGEG